MAAAAQPGAKPETDHALLPTGGETLPPSHLVPKDQEGRRWRFDVEAYYKMANLGILKDDDRVELIDGDILVMSPIGIAHAAACLHLGQILFKLVSEMGLVSLGNPLQIDQFTLPQPDIMLLRQRADNYRSAHPTPADVHVLIEIMDTTASHDRGKKLALSAAAGIPEVWLVDIPGELIEVCRGPVEGIYTQRRELKRGESLSPEAFPDAVIGVDAVLG